MKILILSQYFPPETGAPQNRLFELALRLQRKGAEITVLTAMPNYPQMEIHEVYRNKRTHYEVMDGLKVYRSSIYVSRKRSIGIRLLNYFSFVYSSWKLGRSIPGDFDYLLCESPPLFLGISAWLLKRKKRARLIFNVSDLWPESAEKLGLVSNRLFLSMATRLEEFLYRNSELITGQTQGIVTTIKNRFPDKEVYWLPNGVDLALYCPQNAAEGRSWKIRAGFEEKDFIFFYGGILGHAQGLEVILKAALKLNGVPQIKFVLLGSGPEKDSLLKLKSELGLSQVHFFDAVGKTDIPAILDCIDVALIPLKRLDLFKGAIPSKIFESLAMKKPLLLGVEGEARELFIDEARAGLAFVPEDASDLAAKVLEMYGQPELVRRMGENGFDYVRAKFTRDIIAEGFWDFLMKDQQRIKTSSRI
jgi:glycosyltransferase involved in cell wall biosynthesis